MAGMLEKPEDRTPALEKLLDAAGIRLLSSYWTFGDHDFLVIVEAEKEHEWMKVLLLTASTGGLCDLKTTVRCPQPTAKRLSRGQKPSKGRFIRPATTSRKGLDRPRGAQSVRLRS